MKLTRIFLVVVMALLAISVVTACSKDTTAPKSDTESKSSDGGSGDGDGKGGGKVIDVALSEFKIKPNEFSVDKGQKVTFKVTNYGTLGHNFTISELNETVAVEPGQTSELEVTFDKAGTFNIVCTVDAHESKGMTGEIVVK